MSKYTTELRFICETLSGLSESVGETSVEDVIAGAREKIFTLAYPIYDEDHREVLELKILRHYYTQEIGAETFGRWKLFLNTRMSEIMPKYNMIYARIADGFNALNDADYTRSGTDNRETQDSGTDQVSNSGESWDYYSDTPQGGIQGVADRTYLTSARNVTDEGSGSTTYGKKTDDDREYFERVKGKFPGKSQTELLAEFQAQYNDVDVMIINELSDLFMGLW